jgi:N-acetylglucosaminyldiphosphoundecaprenol N-acetyl-beta-D-mannosaminyltransferase
MQQDVKRTNVLGVGVSAINMEQAVSILLDARAQDRGGYVCVTGVHGVIESQRDPELKRIHNRSLLTVPDGMPTVWVGREQGFVHMGRVYGPDLMLRLCEATAEVDRSTFAEATADKCSLMVDGEAGGKAGNQRTEDGYSTTTNHQPITDKKCFTHFLYGSTPETLVKLKTNLEKKFPGIRIVGTWSPPFRPLTEEEEAELQAIVAECKPDFFWVGLSTPKQERFMFEHCSNMSVGSCSLMVDGELSKTSNHEQSTESGVPTTNSKQPTTAAIERYPLDCGIMLGVGAAFDIHAGLLKDAPEWVKNSGLQWLYRLCQEPRRLWRRYLDIVPKFLSLVALQMLGIRQYEVE